MNTITIPKNLIKNDDLVVIPRKEYETLIKLKTFKEFIPSFSQKKALLTAERNFKKGTTLSYNGLVKKLGFAN